MKILITAALLALTVPAHARDQMREIYDRAVQEQERERQQGQWFLILDTWYCDTGGCTVRGKPEEWVLSETYPSEKFCYIAGQYITKIETDRFVPDGFYYLTPAKISPRCVWHRFDP